MNELKSELKQKPAKYYLIFSILLSLACALSLILALVDPVEINHRISEVHFFKDVAKVWYLFWPLFIVVALKRLNKGDQNTVYSTWIGAFAILSIIGMIQYFTGWPRLQAIPGEAGRYHATLFLGHHLSVASILIFPFFATLELAYRLPELHKRIICVLILALGLITLIFTYSRTLWIAIPIGIGAWAILTLPKRLKLPALGSVLLLCLIAFQHPSIHRRLQDVMGVGIRQELWLANIEFLKKRPLTGVGWRHNQELSGYYFMEKFKTNDVFSGHAHNNLLDLLSGTGIMGALTWILWCAWVIYLLIYRKENPVLFRKGLLCAWIVFHLNGLTQVNFWEAKVQHQIAWVIAWSLL